MEVSIAGFQTTDLRACALSIRDEISESVHRLMKTARIYGERVETDEEDNHQRRVVLAQATMPDAKDIIDAFVTLEKASKGLMIVAEMDDVDTIEFRRRIHETGCKAEECHFELSDRDREMSQAFEDCYKEKYKDFQQMTEANEVITKALNAIRAKGDDNDM